MNALFVPLHWLWACYAPAALQLFSNRIVNGYKCMPKQLAFSISTISIMYMNTNTASSIISIIQVSTTYNNKQ